jgi:hypothetical protein
MARMPMLYVEVFHNMSIKRSENQGVRVLDFFEIFDLKVFAFFTRRFVLWRGCRGCMWRVFPSM